MLWLREPPGTRRSKSSSLELTEQIIRKRAYQLWEENGGQDGHDLDDWFQAETEILGGKKRAVQQAEPMDDTAL